MLLSDGFFVSNFEKYIDASRIFALKICRYLTWTDHKFNMGEI